MEPIKITWEGSSDAVTISRSDNQTYDTRDAVAEFLASTLPNFWEMVDDPERPGEKMSVDQRGKWRAVQADLFYEGCPILIARHTASGNGIIAVAIAKWGERPGEAELVVQTTGGYAHADVDPRMLGALKGECALRNAVLGHAVVTRTWVSL